MAKTTKIVVACFSAEICVRGREQIDVTITDPDVDEILGEITGDDIDNWVRNNKEPEDIFSTTQLESWAEANGYVKGGDNAD